MTQCANGLLAIPKILPAEDDGIHVRLGLYNSIQRYR